jgi:four helix bundle protein
LDFGFWIEERLQLNAKDMSMENCLKRRTKNFALDIIKLTRLMPKDLASITIARQVVRSGTSVAANYRSACRGKSKSEFIAKLAIAEEEADETQLWLELMVESEIVKPALVNELIKEAGELVSIFVASIKTARTQISKS